MRYVLVPMVGQITVVAPPAPAPSPPLTDLTATFASKVDGSPTAPASVTFAFPAYDPTKVQPPAESRLYLLAAGSPQPPDGPAFAASTLPYTLKTDPVPPEGSTAYPIDCPSVPNADYAWYLVHGYAV